MSALPTAITGAASGMPCVLGSSGQERHGTPGMDPEEGNKECTPLGKAEGAGAVTQEQMSERTPPQCLNKYLKGRS